MERKSHFKKWASHFNSLIMPKGPIVGQEIFILTGQKNIFFFFQAMIALSKMCVKDLDCGQGDPGSNPGEGMSFFLDGELSGSHIVCFHMW